jgi:hypothetical protein
VNLLHDEKGPLTPELRIRLLDEDDALPRFIQHDLLQALQQAGKMNLANFFNELSYDKRTLITTITDPMVRYQHELTKTDTAIFSASERFQCKLLSTKNTFAGHPDRGGYICLIGEFDQIRLRYGTGQEHGTPVIVEFKKGLGAGKKKAEEPLPGLFAELAVENAEENNEVQPTDAHAMQLLTYWLAFQTRWNKIAQYKEARGAIQEFPMSIDQPLELLLYNLNDGYQYLLDPSDRREALTALVECIFYLNWAMKSGYAWQSPEHTCKRAKLTELPEHAIQVQVGATLITGQECYLLAKAAFERFQKTIRWKRITQEVIQ